MNIDKFGNEEEKEGNDDDDDRESAFRSRQSTKR